MTRTGKIARLPRDVRNELNRRIDNGEQGTLLIAWLNGLPETKRVLAQGFDGREINDQNLSDWKAGGFQDWLALEEVLAQAKQMAEKTHGLVEVAEAVGTEDLAAVMNLRTEAVLAEWDGEVTEAFERKLKTLRRLAMVVMGLRRSRIQAERWQLEQAKYEDAIEKEIQEDEIKRNRPSFEEIMWQRLGQGKGDDEETGKRDAKRVTGGGKGKKKSRTANVEKEGQAGAPGKATKATEGKGAKTPEKKPYFDRRTLNPFLHGRREMEAFEAIQGNSSHAGNAEQQAGGVSELGSLGVKELKKKEGGGESDA